jgi:hypothetical protein
VIEYEKAQKKSENNFRSLHPFVCLH